MWSGRSAAETPHPPAAVWDAVVALHAGRLRIPGLDEYRLDGPLAVGSTVRAVHPAGGQGPAMTIDTLQEGHCYAHTVQLRRYVLRFSWTVEPTSAGSRLTREVQITGPMADLATPTLGREIAAAFPGEVAALLAAVGPADG